ncbi:MULTISPECIES: pseudouridine synthase [unclassified Pseudodesulfovibrio]|uniref:pseudouridine synthase n=1 Tax=unclassified Pseudodesulfovibrio TaxID=2661612 RepID=UPI000FEB7D6D|nr:MULTISPECIES: pseudouridine synthase [unclassified Pseudodesulfovibrio]MCJ2163828.1 rRNA pseudouridine synthase [Pseudodesulfovibrio sp. S3-i]RWU05925.1 rRNA pseudouridine synthase [Pseudodesulfovibrio sp. S3]
MSDASTESIRLNKFIAQCGITSRRGADDLVFSGQVKVNGIIADSPGIKVDPDNDTVTVKGKTIALPGKGRELTIVLHKPVETVTTVNDPQGRKTVLDFLPNDIKKLRPFPVGRLDFFSEGLLLLTTDGELCYRLTHPKFHLPKIYVVTIRGSVQDRAVMIMRKGMVLRDGDKLAPAKVEVSKPVAGTQQIEITLIQGINRQIRRMCEELGMTILRLKRVQQGPIDLGKLKRGEWRELSKEELIALKKAVKLA